MMIRNEYGLNDRMVKRWKREYLDKSDYFDEKWEVGPEVQSLKD
tara:strand:- start:782 stop:913 length:132 start_codon:yes stop_codon:yes gene_type:complete